jgi:predicted AAA+ superfamily ATPase
LFIDEIQYIAGWEKIVNSYSQDFSAQYEIFISGSNAQMLSGELASLLSGRYVQFEIFPLNFQEYVGWTKKEINKQTFFEFLQSGGLPELLNLQSEESKRNYVASVKDTVFLRDIVERYKISEPKLLEDIFVYLLNNLASLTSISKILNFFKSKNRKTTYDTVANYISYMQNAFIVHKSERFNIRGKETVSGNCKYYINDLAYKNYLYAGFDFAIGKQLENLVYLELLRNGFLAFTGCLPNNEIDFIAIKNDRTLYLQISYILSDEKTIERAYAALEKIKDSYEKYVISLDEAKFHIRNGIKHLQAWRLYEILN